MLLSPKDPIRPPMTHEEIQAELDWMQKKHLYSQPSPIRDFPDDVKLAVAKELGLIDEVSDDRIRRGTPAAATEADTA